MRYRKSRTAIKSDFCDPMCPSIGYESDARQVWPMHPSGHGARVLRACVSTARVLLPRLMHCRHMLCAVVGFGWLAQHVCSTTGSCSSSSDALQKFCNIDHPHHRAFPGHTGPHKRQYKDCYPHGVLHRRQASSTGSTGQLGESQLESNTDSQRARSTEARKLAHVHIVVQQRHGISTGRGVELGEVQQDSNTGCYTAHAQYAHRSRQSCSYNEGR